MAIRPKDGRRTCRFADSSGRPVRPTPRRGCARCRRGPRGPWATLAAVVAAVADWLSIDRPTIWPVVPPPRPLPLVRLSAAVFCCVPLSVVVLPRHRVAAGQRTAAGGAAAGRRAAGGHAAAAGGGAAAGGDAAETATAVGTVGSPLMADVLLAIWLSAVLIGAVKLPMPWE